MSKNSKNFVPTVHQKAGEINRTNPDWRLDLIRNHPEYQENLWKIVRALQNGFRERGFDIGGTLSPVTPVYMKGGVEEACNIVVDLLSLIHI